MTLKEISLYRLINQQVADSRIRTAEELVHWMGAMQAQDYAMAKWAIGSRLNSVSDKDVEAALNKANIIRTHVLRPTWHLVSPDNIYWMLELTSPHIKSSMRSRHKELELNDTVLKKSNKLIQKALEKENHLTREELFNILNKSNINTQDQRGAHILLNAELDAIICNGPLKGKEQSYALLENRVRKKSIVTREESLAKLAGIYFSSHGPATLQDFIWWSGLPIRDARNALEMIKTILLSEKLNDQTYYLKNNSNTILKSASSVFLLAAYDEFIISYKDRSPSLLQADQKKTISSNGIFRPVIVSDGKVIGIWKRSIKKDTVIIEPDFFISPDNSIQKQLVRSSKALGSFLNLKVQYLR